MTTTVVVIPNHLPHLDFLHDWREQLRDVPIIVVQDVGPKPRSPYGYSDVTIVDHADIEADLGGDDWIIPTRTSACRSYGYYLAWKRNPDIIVTLDTDCYPDGSDLIGGHAENLAGTATLDWVNSAPEGPMFRGFPYGIRGQAQIMLSHGLWSSVPDLDAPTQLHHPGLRLRPAQGVQTVPRWSFFPMCGMNLAWRPELTPAMYFGLFGPDYGFDQYDDIWAGVLVKRILDHLGMAAVSGYPSVEHRRQSNVYANLRKQAPGMAMNEHFWRVVRDLPLTGTTIAGCYRELIDGLPDTVEDEPDGWTAKFKKAASIWLGLFE
jgi:hypothetical protein